MTSKSRTCRTDQKARNTGRQLPLELLEDRIVLNGYVAANAAELIAAIDASNLAGGANTITLTAANTTPYTLSAVQNTFNGANGLPVVFTGNNLTIVGDGDTIRRDTAVGTPAFRLFDVAGGASLALKGLALTDGWAVGAGVAGQGGAVYNSGTLTLDGVLVRSNVAGGTGGGIANDGVLTLSASTIVGNQAATGGGGIYNAGALSVSAATIAGNTSTSNSLSSFGGGGIFTRATGSAALINTIVAGNADNRDGGRGRDVAGGQYEFRGRNLIGSYGGDPAFLGNVGPTEQVGSLGYPIDPLLAPLGDYGGPTQTMALLPGSPALGRGDPGLAGAADQRGISRNQPQGVDIGAYQSRGFTVTVAGGNNQSAPVTAKFANPLAVQVSSAFGEPVAGGVVGFTSPIAGASAALPAASIDASGLANSKPIANGVIGSYQVTAGGAGVASPAAFDLANTTVPTSVSGTFVLKRSSDSVDQLVSLKASVSGPVAVNNGTVTFAVFYNGAPFGAALPPCPVVSGGAKIVYALPANALPGDYTVVASYAPADPRFVGSSNTAYRIVVAPAVTTTTAAFGFAPGSAADQVVPLSAVIKATPGVGPLNGGTVTFKVFKNGTQIGAAVTSAPVVNGKAGADYTLPGGTAVGSYAIVATYNPGPIYAGSSDGGHTLDVGLTDVFANDVFAPFDPAAQAVTLSAQLLTPSPGLVINGGTITFEVLGAGGVIGAITSGPVVNNYASVSYALPGGVPTGFYRIVATYKPAPGFTGSIDASHQLQVGVTRVTMGLALQSAVVSAGNQIVSLMSTVAPETGSGVVNEGTVTFRLLSADGLTQFGTAVTSGTVTNGKADVTYVVPGGTPAGAYKVLAVYNPSPRYFTSAKTSPFQILQNVPAIKVNPIVTVSGTDGPYNGNPLPVSAKAVDVDGATPVAGSFTYGYYAGSTAGGAPLATAPTSAGVYTVVALFTSSNPNYANATAQDTFKIATATPTVNVSAGGGTYTGSPFAATAVAVGLDGATPLAGSFTFTYYAGTYPGGTPLQSAPTDPGTYTAVAIFGSANPNYRSTAGQAGFTINPAPPTITTFTIPATGVEGGEVNLIATATSFDASPLNYTWTVTGPGAGAITLFGPTTRFTPGDNGAFIVSLTVDADNGTSVTRAGSLAVANADPIITTFAVPAMGTEGNAVALDAAATDADPALTYAWTVTRPDGTAFTLAGPSASFTPADDGRYVVSLSAGDGDGGVDARTVALPVYTRAASAKIVQALYGRELGRGAGQAEVTFQVGTLDGPGGQASAASGIANSTEARVRLVAGWFQTFLARASSANENTFWAGVLGGQTEEQALAQILGSTEFFARAQGTNPGGTPNQNYVRALYQALLGRAAGAAEVDAQVNALPALGQQGVALGLLRSVEYRASVVRGYYASLLGRAGSQAEVAGQVNSAGDLRAIRAGIESSVEFLIVSAGRPPAITAFAAPATGLPAAAVTLSAAADNAAGNFFPLTYAWAVTRPDGTTLATLTGRSATFTPPASGKYGVRLTVADEDGFNVTRTATVTALSAAPIITSITVPAAGATGTPVTLAAAATLPAGVTAPLTYTWTITRPDGTTFTLAGASTSFTPAGGGGYGVALAVTYPDGVAATLPVAGLTNSYRAEGSALDAQGGKNGTLIGGATYAPGKVGQAFSLDGVGAYVALPDNLVPYPTTGAGNAPLSFETWFRTDTGGVILNQKGATSGYVPAVYVGTDGRLRAQMFFGGAVDPIVSPTAVNDGQFHHVAVTFDGASQTVYLDGVAIGTKAFTQTAYAASYQYQLGSGQTAGWVGGNGGAYFFKGLIDEAAFYDRALSAADVRSIVNAGGVGKSPSVSVRALAVVGATFDYAARVHAVSLTLAGPAPASLSAADLTVTNLTTGAAIPAAAIGLVIGHDPETVTLSFAGLPDSTLPDGRYRLAIPSAGSYTFDFFSLAADFNHDGHVDFGDLVALAQNYNATGKIFAQGDANRDGRVDFGDLVPLAQRYNTSLPNASAAVPNASGAPASFASALAAAFATPVAPAPAATPPTPAPPTPAPTSPTAPKIAPAPKLNPNVAATTQGNPFGTTRIVSAPKKPAHRPPTRPATSAPTRPARRPV